ncbi:MAG: exo-alpha-sialidase, partial [Deltaproteobacteria bacterium]
MLSKKRSIVRWFLVASAILGVIWLATPKEMHRRLGDLRIYLPLDEIAGKIPWIDPAVRASGTARVVAQGDDIQVTDDDLPQLEPAIAVNPLDPDNIVVGFMGITDVPEQRCGYAVTKDGGATWRVRQSFPDLPHSGGADPVIVADADGIFYASCLNFTGTSDTPQAVPETLTVSRSDDGGETWLSPTHVVSRDLVDFLDKEWLAVDRTDGPYAGRVYMAYVYFPFLFANIPHNQVQIVHSDDGLSFSSPVRVSDTLDPDILHQGVAPGVDHEGTIHLVWMQFGVLSQLLYDRSTDGGETWGRDVTITNIRSVPQYGIAGFYRVPTMPAFGVDATEGPYQGHLYAVWNGYDHGDADIFMVRSTDGGTTWEEPRRINDDVVGNGKDQLFPAIVVDRAGIVRIMWLDRRDDPENL